MPTVNPKPPPTSVSEQGNQAKSGEFRPTIDVYALGATLYKLLTRETPPAASELVSDDELVEDNLREKGVPTNLIKVVTEAMCPNVKKRIQTVRDFKNQLSSNAVPSVAESKRAENEEQNFTADEETIVGLKIIATQIIRIPNVSWLRSIVKRSMSPCEKL